MKELKPTNITGPLQDPDNLLEAKTSDGHYRPSWIWLVPCGKSATMSDSNKKISEDNFNDYMCVE